MALIIATAPVCTSNAYADPAADNQPPRAKHFEASAGADVGSNHWLLYSSTTIAPFGDMFANGVRLRFTGGYGRYNYQSFRYLRGPRTQSFDAVTTFAEGLVGYHQKLGPLTAKAFVGVAQIDHSITPLDPGNRVSGSEIGIKGIIELWLDISRDWYGSLDLAYTTAHVTRSARVRLGYRLEPKLSVGLEARLNQDAQSDYKVSDDEDPSFRQEPLDYAWLGAFARYEWETGEVSASAGLNMRDVDIPDGTDDYDPSLYGTLNVLMRF